MDAALWSLAYRTNPIEDVHLVPHRGGARNTGRRLAIRGPLDSQRFSSAPRTCRPLCGRLRLR